MFKIKLEIPPEIEKKLKDMSKETKRGLLEGMKKSMFLAERVAKESFNTPDHLRVLSGTLRRSIEGRADWEGSSVIGSLGSHIIYAAIHEFGGYAGKGRTTFIPERKYLRPAIGDNLDEIRNIILNEILKEVEK